MNKIIVIGTHHQEVGACTSDALLKIIQKISPSVIFFEASPEEFPAMLKSAELTNIPEIKAIRVIIETRSTDDVIPVDLNQDPLFLRRVSSQGLCGRLKLSAVNSLLNSLFLELVYQEVSLIFSPVPETLR